MRKLFSIGLLMMLLLVPAYGQVATAELSGTVFDPTGAAVPNAQVTAIATATNLSRQATTTANGHYTLTLLPPGDYRIEVEAPGFRKLVQTGTSLQINQQAEVNLTLQVGEVSQTTQVTGQAPLLETESSSLGTVVNQRLTNELPLNGRNFIQLATLSPGVNGVGFSASGTIMSGSRPDDRRPGTEIFSNGNREGSNNFLYDGIDDNERLTLSIVLRPAVEAVREFKIQTNLYSADVGRNSGAVVDVITKSGTNQLHGSLFEYLRNSAMDARDFFNPQGTAFPTFRLNQFGGSFGGPVVIPKIYNGRNRTFFFVDYEGYRRDAQQINLGSIPTLRMRQGDFGETNTIYDPATTRANPNGSGFIRDPFANNQIPANRWDPISTKMINAYPTPTGTGRINNYLSNMVQNQKWNQGDVRIDHQISSKDNFFARYSIQNTETSVPSTFPATTIAGIPIPVNLSTEASFAGTALQPAQHAVASYVRIISPRLVNELTGRHEPVPPGLHGRSIHARRAAGEPARSSQFECHAAGTELADLFTGELPGYRADAVAADFPPGKHLPNCGQHDVRYGKTHAEVGRRFPASPVDDLSDQHGQWALQLFAGGDGFAPAGTVVRRFNGEFSAGISDVDRARLHTELAGRTGV